MDNEDSGMILSGTIPSMAAKQDSFVNNTILFSRSTGEDKESAENISSENPSGPYIASQGMLLDELQERLAQLDPVEEVDANGNDVSNDVTDTASVSRRVAHGLNPASMFLGVPGSLPSDLKNTLNNRND